jgi:hypothetical protein
MAIKVTLGEVKTQEKKQFPKLMKPQTSDVIWLMLSPTKGICILGDENNPLFQTGNVHEGMGRYMIDYNEPITLQNA